MTFKMETPKVHDRDIQELIKLYPASLADGYKKTEEEAIKLKAM